MVKKKRNYITITFITSVLLFCLSILLILDFTILNKNYIKKQLNRVNYYNEVYNNINMAIGDIFNYSGIYDMDLNNIVNLEDVRNDINSYIDMAYIGRKPEIKLTKLEEKINKKINEYINSHKIKVNNKETISIITKEVLTEYKNKISFYGYFQTYVGKFYKIKICIVCLSLIMFVLFIVSFILFLKFNSLYISVPITTNIILFLLITLYIRENINYENIFVISTEFSKVLSTIINNLTTINKVIIIRSLMINFCILVAFLFKRGCKNVKNGLEYTRLKGVLLWKK